MALSLLFKSQNCIAYEIPLLQDFIDFFFGTSDKKAVYTCITGQYDQLIAHSYVCDQWDYICFTDNPELLEKGHSHWQIRPLQFTALDPTRNSRWHKVFPHKILPEYNVSLYVDGNIDILTPDLFQYVDQKLLPKEMLAIHPHFVRDCIYAEAKECIHFQLDSEEIIEQQVLRLKKLDYPEHNGLQENNVIFRRHHNSLVKQVMESWWWWITSYSKRDQLSFNYVIWLHRLHIHTFEEQFVRNPKYGMLHSHIGKRS
jgi:hypothetical protein